MTPPPLFSIVVPTYDRPDFLRAALESVREQTCSDFECIVVEDAPPRRSATVPEDPRFRLLRHETNRGVAAARNTGLRAATGRYVAFLDDDDLFAPDRLAVAVPHLAPHTAVVCRRGGEDGSVMGYRDLQGCVVDEVLDGFTPHLGQTTVWRRLCPLFDERYAALEDVEWWLRVASTLWVRSVSQTSYLTRLNERPRHANGAAERARCSRLILADHADYFRGHRRARAFRYERLARLEEGLDRHREARVAALRSLLAVPRARTVRLALALCAPASGSRQPSGAPGIG